MHAAVIAINEAIGQRHADVTYGALGNAQAHLVHLCAEQAEHYQQHLFDAKQHKLDIATNKVRSRTQQPVFLNCSIDYSSVSDLLEYSFRYLP